MWRHPLSSIVDPYEFTSCSFNRCHSIAIDILSIVPRLFQFLAFILLCSWLKVGACRTCVFRASWLCRDTTLPVPDGFRMAAVAQSGAREALSTYPSSPVASPCDTSSLARGDSPSATRSPRCEAFVMTGDKILNLNQHISPNYAKVSQIFYFSRLGRVYSLTLCRSCSHIFCPSRRGSINDEDFHTRLFLFWPELRKIT